MKKEYSAYEINLSLYSKTSWFFIAAMIFLCIEATADLLQPTFMGYIVDNGVKDANIGQIMYYGAIMLGIAAVGAFSAVMRNIFFMSYFTIYRQKNYVVIFIVKYKHFPLKI